MRIALCLYGQLRDYYKAIGSWDRFIVKYKPDIYWHTWDKPPTYGIFAHRLKYGIVEAQKEFNTCGVTEWSSSARNVHSQLYSMQCAVSLFTGEYDFVVRSRFDLILHQPEALIFEQLDPSKFYVCHNHWCGSITTFDDNLMISSPDNIFQHNLLVWYLRSRYYEGLRVIPSGEQLFCDYFTQKGLMKDLVRTDLLNFDLARTV